MEKVPQYFPCGKKQKIVENFEKFWKTLENFGKGSAVLPLWQEAENVQSQKAAVSEYRLPSADLYF